MSVLTPATLDLLIATYPALRSLAAPERQALAAEARALAFAAHTRLFREGDAHLSLPLLQQGHVRVTRELPTGQSVTLYRLEPGELCVVSAACVLAGRPALASGIAEDAVSAVAVPAPLVNRLLSGSQDLRDTVFRAFAARTASLFALLDDLALRSLDQRLAALLLARAPIVQATHQMLADELGTVREVVSRILERFATRRLVRLSRGRVEVLHGAGLRQIVSRAGLPAVAALAARVS